ncbi:MAG TPA: leucyl aminopeptidase [Caulobacterales bacterium]|jgi:leucyl aminopeptidase|nr:leucyl aminopeptidase [Caulobacterales bacterium]
MEVNFVKESRGDAIALMATEGGVLTARGQEIEQRLGGAIARAAAVSRFTGAAGQVLELLGPQGLDAPRLLVVGLGPADKIEPIGVERWAGAAVRRTLSSGVERLVLLADSVPNAPAAEAAARAAVGSRLAAYRFDKYRTRLKPEQKVSLQAVDIVTEGPAAAKSRYEPLSHVADGVLFARDLMNEPANVLYPDEFAQRVRAALDPFEVEVEVLDEDLIRKHDMHALLGVGLGSERETRLVTMSWRGARAKGSQPLALVGKGVTFDTGGISIKPAAGMDEMKGDMGGAAAVVGAIRALAGRKARANVVGVIGLVENMPDGAAQRPGDIVSTMSGQTIEVLNTDAEGRLVLADAVWYAQEKFNPTAVIDFATLTGAVIVALGNEHAGLFANDDELAHAITQAAAGEGENVWRLPLGPAYDKLIDSPNADVKNIAGKPVAGSIIGAQFIQRFIKPGTPWAHLDIAGTAWKAPPYEDPISPSWATGYGVRLVNRLVATRYEE